MTRKTRINQFYTIERTSDDQVNILGKIKSWAHSKEESTPWLCAANEIDSLRTEVAALKAANQILKRNK